MLDQLVDVFRAYPLGSILLIVAPILVGVLTPLVGFEGLTARLSTDRQLSRIENGVGNLAVPAETVRRYQTLLQQAGLQSQALSRILGQYDQLKRGIETFEQFRGNRDLPTRMAAADYILGELRVVLGSVVTQQVNGAEALILKTGPNTFIVTFSVPMRIPPRLTFVDLPDGVSAHVVDLSTLGFTVIFTPLDKPVERFGFAASAEL